ncbi:YhgE/Pip domain-containing protein [Chengkuizengella axinellae]|uniref:YhgE/Pip domain-containing protein n=1 Tax=Chengkuizengella axinellae TaxID=3064388 RepID=A0ABT9IZ25_9BACL|nr:YhgE/Pip domain-containing protein [Chengkuizengella sp. 2205SS18-9]MDP5274624.1 YhgE/Pip domain-containing protein [Chengkuizengella sp. 2205SS18-9]
MSGVRLAYKDLKHMWSTKILRTSLIVAMLLPLLYNFVYLWAYWDPEDNIDELPLAVINKDIGTVNEGENVNLGEDLVEQLLDDDQTNWTLLPEDQTEKSILSEGYVLILNIPSDFSEKALSVGSDHPQSATLTYIFSEGSNAISAKISNAIIDQVETKLDQELSTRYLEIIYENVLNGGEGLQEAADGAQLLAEAVDKAHSGSNELSDGLVLSSSGMEELSDGLTQLLNGANQLENGIIQLNTSVNLASDGANEISDELEAAHVDLSNLSNSLETFNSNLNHSIEGIQDSIRGVNETITVIQNLKEDVQKLQEDLTEPFEDPIENQRKRIDEAIILVENIIEDNPEWKENEQLGSVVESLEKAIDYQEQIKQDRDEVSRSYNRLIKQLSLVEEELKETNEELILELETIQEDLLSLQIDIENTENNLNERIDKIAAIPNQLQTVAEGTNQLQEGSTLLVEGLNEFSNGFSKLQAGNDQLLLGSNALKDGLDEIKKGQYELADGLNEAAQLAAKDGKSDQRIDVIVDPLLVEEKNLHPVLNNGTGFAPYFIALSLWVGSLVLFLAIDIKTVSAMPKRPSSYIVNKYLKLTSVSLVQAVISVFILLTGLQLDLSMTPIHLYGFVILMGFVYTAILFMITYILGNDAGRVVAILLLMAQLTSSSGSYPVVLQPGLFEFIAPYLPMTYAVEGLRNIISIGDMNSLMTESLILCGFGVGALLLLYVIKRKSFLHEIEERELS